MKKNNNQYQDSRSQAGKHNKLKKELLAVSALCVGIGAICMGVGLAFGGVPGVAINKSGFHTMGAKGIEKLEKTKTDSFSNINIDIPYGDVEIVPSDEYFLEYQLGMDGRSKIHYEVKDNTLTVAEETKGFYLVLFDFKVLTEPSKIKIYVPENIELSSIVIDTEEGNVTLPDIQAETLSLASSYGEINMKSFDGEALIMECEETDISIGKIRADLVKIENEYGDMSADGFEVKDGAIQMESGNLNLEGVKMCESLSVKNEYGDITIARENPEEVYGFNLKTEYGTISIPDGSIVLSDDEAEYRTNGTEKQNIIVKCEEGDITIK